MSKRLIKSLAVLSIALFVVISGKMPDTVFAATPKNQTFDTTAAANGVNSMEIDGLTYTTDTSTMQVFGYEGCFVDYTQAQVQAQSAYFAGKILTNDGTFAASPHFLQIKSTDAGNNFNLSSMYFLASDLGDGHVIKIEGYNGNTKVYSVTGIDLGATSSYSTGALNGESVSISNVISTTDSEYGGLLTFTGWNDFDTIRIINNAGDTKAIYAAVDSLTFSNVVDISVNDVTVNEDANNAIFTVSLSKAYGSDITVGYSTQDNVAVSASDYTSETGPVTILKNTTSATITVPITDDDVYEANESFNLNLTSASIGGFTDGQGKCTINNNDNEPTVALSASGSSFSEAGGSATITATLSNKSYLPVTVTLGYSGTAIGSGKDYTADTSIVIPAGSLSNSITVTGVDDDIYEGSENVTADITGVTNGSENGAQQVTNSITDNESQPVVSLALSGSSVSEQGGTVTVTANLSGKCAKAVTVTLGFSGTAVSGTDFTASDTTITLPAESTSNSITLTCIDNTTYTGDKAIKIDITDVANAAESGEQQQTATITENDPTPSVTLDLVDSPLAEDGGKATIRATLSGTSPEDITVNLAFTGTAVNGTDYSISAASITIPAGSTSGTATITGIDDTAYEAVETVILDISSVTGAIESTEQTVTASITDDDTQPKVTLSTDKASVSENGGTVSITAMLSNKSYQDVTVTLGLSGTAVNGTDYTASGTDIVILAGSLSGSITVTGTNDTAYEDTETIAAEITNVKNGTENSEQKLTISIIDDEIIITGFDSITGINAGYVGSTTYADAAAVSAALPATVAANGGTVTVPVIAWTDTDGYNPSTAGSYTFTATLGTLPSGYVNVGGYTAIVEVVVTAVGQIASFDTIPNVNAGYVGSAVSGSAIIVKLPAAVTANGGTVTVAVTSWTDTDGYNPSVAGSYTFTATLGSLPSGYANAGGYTATVEVIVIAPGQLIFDPIANLNAGNAGSAAYADAAAVAAALPDTVTASGGAISVSVISWTDTDGYNPAVPGSYTFTAVLGAIPGGYTIGGAAFTVEAVVNAITPNAPNVSLDDTTNKLIGADSTMEYSTDGGITWAAYSVSADPVFEGNVTVLIRVAAIGGNPAGPTTSLSFTANSTAPVNNNPSDPGGSGSTGTSDSSDKTKVTRKVDVNAGDESGTATSTVATVDIVREVTGDKKVDTVVLDEKKTKEVLEKVTDQKQNLVQIVIDDIKDDPADEVSITINNNSMDQLSDSDKALEVTTEEVSIQVPKETVKSLAQREEDLYFRVVPIRDEAAKEETIHNAITADIVIQTAGNGQVQAIGAPMTIETSYQNYMTKVIFSLKNIIIPLDEKERKEFVDSLAIYIKHSDGTEEINRGKLVYDENGNPTGIEIEISKFSTFTMISIKNSAPTAGNLTLSGRAKIGKKLTAVYIYSDAEDDKQGNSIIKWYRADNKNGKNKKQIKGVSGLSYKIRKADRGKYIIFEVTPVAKTGKTTGKASSIAIKIPDKSTAKKDNTNTAPEASRVKITGKMRAGSK